MIVADDGGAQISFDGGDNWSTYMNQATAQFYRVSTDNHFPYRILGAQQDNSTVRILSRSNGGQITQDDWQTTAGAESGYVVADPTNPDIVYALVQAKDGTKMTVNLPPNDNQLVNILTENVKGNIYVQLTLIIRQYIDSEVVFLSLEHDWQ